ncbi:hypothetical protein MB828_00855 [Streptomyces arenae]|nr:hypothetical protein [Streptomyces arenae]MCG7202396.1 hypothetical protein [Streptomyces arenae]
MRPAPPRWCGGGAGTVDGAPRRHNTDARCYVRLRGSDGKRGGTGYLGASVDPYGPIPHEPGNGDPWADTWFYSNPIFVGVVN